MFAPNPASANCTFLQRSLAAKEARNHGDADELADGLAIDDQRLALDRRERMSFETSTSRRSTGMRNSDTASATATAQGWLAHTPPSMA